MSPKGGQLIGEAAVHEYYLQKAQEESSNKSWIPWENEKHLYRHEDEANSIEAQPMYEIGNLIGTPKDEYSVYGPSEVHVLKRMGGDPKSKGTRYAGKFIGLKYTTKSQETNDVTTSLAGNEVFLLYKLKALDHPNIAKVYDILFYPKKDFEVVVTELIAGVSMKEVTQEIPFQKRFKHTVPIVEQLANALDTIHHENMAHGDVKSGNVVLQHDGKSITPKLIDFGSAVTSEKKAFLDFTPGYVAPETINTDQLPALEELKTGDNYALAVIAYEFITGKVPQWKVLETIKTLGRDPFNVAIEAALSPYIPIEQNMNTDDIVALGEEKIVKLNTVFKKALATLPQNRYKTASEFAQALKEIL